MRESRGTPVPPGSQLGRFKLVSFLGRGAFGEVYLAHDRKSGRRVSLKLLSRSATAAARAGLEREAAALRRLHQPGVPGVVSFGEVAGRLYLALVYVDGETLRERLSRGRMEPGAVLALARSLAEVLAGCHAQGVVHGDLKPENVVLDPEGGVYLLDFGLAEVRGLPPRGTCAGTPQYMAPEQLRGGPPSEEADLFQVGALLFECLRGRPAFPHHRSRRAALRARGQAPDLPEGVPEALRRAVAGTLEPDPARRLGDAAALGSLLGGAPGTRALALREGEPGGRRRSPSGPQFVPVREGRDGAGTLPRAWIRYGALPVLWLCGFLGVGPLLAGVPAALDLAWALCLGLPLGLVAGHRWIPPSPEGAARRRRDPTSRRVREGWVALGWGTALGVLLALTIPGFCFLGPCPHAPTIPALLGGLVFLLSGLPFLVGGAYTLGPDRVLAALHAGAGEAFALEALAPGLGPLRQEREELLPWSLGVGALVLLTLPLGVGVIAGGFLWAWSLLAVLQRGVERLEARHQDEARMLLEMEESSEDKARCQAGMAILTSQLARAARRGEWRVPALARGRSRLDGELVRILAAAIPEVVPCLKGGRLEMLATGGGLRLYCQRHNLCPAPLPDGVDRGACTHVAPDVRVAEGVTPEAFSTASREVASEVSTES